MAVLLVVMAGVASCSALSARMSPGCARLTLRGGTEDLRKELEFTYSTTEPNAIDELLADVEKERPQSNDGAEAAAVSEPMERCAFALFCADKKGQKINLGELRSMWEGLSNDERKPWIGRSSDRLKASGGGVLKEEETPTDPKTRKELFNSVPRTNHKEAWQQWKGDRMPKKSRGPIWREIRDFACGSVVGTRDFILDNSGLLIYKVLPFTIAALHLPYFRDVTEGMKVFD